MGSKKLVGRTAADKGNKKMGRIIRVDSRPHITTKKLIPHFVILVQRFLRKDVVIFIDETKITKIEDYHVWFEISREEFNQLVKTAEILKDYRREFLADKDYKPPNWSPGKK